MTMMLGACLLLSGCGSSSASEEAGQSEATTAMAESSSQAGESASQASSEGESGQIELIDDEYIENIRESGSLIVGCKTDVPDLSYYDQETDSWSGLEVELAYKTAGLIFGVSPEEAKEQNLVEFVGVTVADREEVLESGDIDCMMATYTITEERTQRFCLSDSYYTDYIGIMVRYSGSDSNTLGGSDITSVADLDGKYIGVPRNATTRDAFIRYIETMNTIQVSPIFCEYESYDQLFQALKNGNIDAMSVDVSILNGYVDDSTQILSTRFAGQHYGAAVTQEHESLISYINAAIRE